MRFLIKTAFWLTLVFLILPSGISHFLSDSHNIKKSESTNEQPQKNNINTSETFFAVRETVTDLSAFCTRNANVCEIGRKAFSTLYLRVQEGVKLGYEFLDERFGDKPAPHDAPAATINGSPAGKTKHSTN